MKNAAVFIVYLCLLSSLLTSCASLSQQSRNLTGNILLWHSWNDEDTLLLNQVLERVTEIAPGTSVITIQVPADELLDRYIVATQQGVGPDILLGADEWVRQLVDANVVRPIELSERELVQYAPTAMEALRYALLDDVVHYYGYPLSLFPEALYRNSQLAAVSPNTLDELVTLTESGETIAIVPRFQPAYWGIQTFGDGLFDDDGIFTLATSGFAEWLTWLVAMQQESGIILNVDDTALEEMYMEGRVSYYVDGPKSLRLFSESINSSVIAVAPLPSGPAGLSGPLLPVEAAMLSTASSPDQAEVAESVARFLANPQQSTTFMRELGRIPANRHVEVDPRVYPTLAGFAQQSRSAVALPNSLNRGAFYLLGDRAYANALSGVLSPEEAVCEFGLDVVELQGYSADEVVLPADCVASESEDQ